MFLAWSSLNIGFIDYSSVNIYTMFKHEEKMNQQSLKQNQANEIFSEPIFIQVVIFLDYE